MAHAETRCSAQKVEDILPIDRGWSWVIAFASSGLFALTAGGFKSQGIIMVEMIEQFPQYSSPTLLWVFTLLFILSCLPGPLFSYIIGRLGSRLSGMIGCAMMTLSYIALAYTTSIPMMICLFSIPAGFGDGLIYLVTYLVSLPYFNKKRALALGIITGGGGLGGFAIPYLIRYLFDNYGYSGGCMLYAAFVCQFMVLICLLRPMSYYERIHAKEIEKLKLSRAFTDEDLHKDFTKVSHDKNLNIDYELSCKEVQVQKEVKKPLEPLLTENSGHLYTQSAILSVGSVPGSVNALNDVMESQKNNEEDTVGNRSPANKFNWRVIIMPKMVMFSCVLFFYALGTSVLHQCIPALAQESGVSKQTAVYAMSFAGLIEAPCRIGNGLFADRKIVSPVLQFMALTFITGLTSLFAAVLPGLPGIIIALGGMAVVGSSAYSLTPIVIEELIGAENVSPAMGMQLVFQSVGYLISSFVTGAIYTQSNSWASVYYYIAASKMMSSIVLWPYYIYFNVKKAKNTDAA